MVSVGDREMDLETALGRLSPWLHDLHDIVQHGFSRYRGYPADILTEHDPRARAACVFCHMWSEAERRFADGARSAAAIVRVRGLSLVGFGDTALVRFKKMDEDGNTRNYPTPQAEAFDAQEKIEGLPPAAVRLSVGYLANPTFTAIERVILSKPNGESAEWSAAIDPAATPAFVDITPEPRFGPDYWRPGRRARRSE